MFGLATLRPTRAKDPSIIKVKIDKKRPLEAVTDWSKSFRYVFFMLILQCIDSLWMLIDCYSHNSGITHVNHPICDRS